MEQTPKLKDEINTEELRTLCAEYIEFCDSSNYNTDSNRKFEIEIFEKAIDIFVSSDFWEWINKKID